VRWNSNKGVLSTEGVQKLQVRPAAQPVGDVPADALHDVFGLESAMSIDGIADDWLGHSFSLKEREICLTAANAPEPNLRRLHSTSELQKRAAFLKRPIV
jgi:hypothetical protein